MRALPDQPMDPDYPKEEWIDQGDEEAALDPNRRKSDKEIKDEKREKSQEILNEEGTSPEDEVCSLFLFARNWASTDSSIVLSFPGSNR